MAADDQTGGQQAVVMVAKAECLHCKHLAGPLGSEKFDCLDDAGCPARHYRIAKGIPVHGHARRLAEAMVRGDADAVATLAAEMRELGDLAITAKVMSLATSRVRELSSE